MALLSDQNFPKVIITEGTVPASPSAGYQKLYIDSADHKLKRVNSSGTVTSIEGAASPTWSSYTPALTAASVNPTLGSGSAVAGRYMQSGNLVVCQGSITFGTSGTAQGTGEYYISLPVNMSTGSTIRTMGTVLMFDNSASQFYTGLAYYSATGVFRIAVTGATPTAGANVPIAWAASDMLTWSITYEAA